MFLGSSNLSSKFSWFLTFFNLYLILYCFIFPSSNDFCAYNFYCIIFPAPYGLREATERIGTTKAEVNLSEDQVETHIPSKVNYSLSQIFSDLLDFASHHLKIGGRLLTWVPVFR